MPDKRSHRGQHPDDRRLFCPDQLPPIRQAVADLSWLLTREYAVDSALKIVGDRYGLTARQRTAVWRSACNDDALADRGRRLVTAADCRGRRVGVDGYNLLITVESALSGGLIFVGRDGCFRDLASIHGTYRKVEETLPAMRLIVEGLRELGVSQVDWYLDRPVANSGRLKALIADLLEGRAKEGRGDPSWNIELVDSPDATLAGYEGVVVTADSAVLDRGGFWVNLAAGLIRAKLPKARVIDIRLVTHN
jgi:hypothetical protein